MDVQTQMLSVLVLTDRFARFLRLKSVLPVVAVSLLVACGGGGSDSPTAVLGSAATAPPTAPAAPPATPPATPTVVPVQRGLFVDAAVAGLRYRTESRSGTTERDGGFDYIEGESVTFSVGGVDLPAAPAKKLMTPLDLAKTNSLEDPTLVNLLVFLQSMDEDANPSNGIQISQSAAVAATRGMNFGLPPQDFSSQPYFLDLVSRRGLAAASPVPPTQAVAHFVATINSGTAGARIDVAPSANAGLVQNVLVGATVTLNGAASLDANSDPLSYAWELVSRPAGSSAVLIGASGVRPSFQADVAGTYVASLVVNDGQSASRPSTVSIAAVVGNVAPVANAGIDQNALVGATTILNGSASADANGDALSYTWTLVSQPAGSVAVVNGATRNQASFVADKPGAYVARLVVSDGKASSAPSLVTITAVVGNAAPVANAGAAQNVAVGANVALSGAASTDPNGDPLSYAWAFVSRPAGSNAALTGANSMQATFRADIPGTYVASLVVNDGKASSSPSTVTVTAALALLGGYPTTTLKCAVGTPMKFERDYSMNYNGGTLRFTPSGEAEQVVIWQTSNITTQQHAGSATFSGPTTDGRQAWLTLSNEGAIIGGGVHGATPDSYVRCGVARTGVAYSGREQVTLECRAGVYVKPDGTPTSANDVPNTLVPTYMPPVTIDFDVSTWPFVRIESKSVNFPNLVVVPAPPPQFVQFDYPLGGRPAMAIYLSGSVPDSPVYFIQDGRVVGYVERTRRTYAPNCGRV